MAARRALVIASAVWLVACDRVSGLSEFEIETSSGGQGGTSAEGGAGASTGGNGGEAGALDCLDMATDSTTTTITWAPEPMTTLDTPVIQVTDLASAFTYVSLQFCTPTGTRLVTQVDLVQCTETGPPCTWTFSTTPLPAGTTQVTFAVMSDTVLVETANIPVAQ